jgi:cyclic pyranopterin phosphate synthase
LDGIKAAKQAGLKIKINTVAMKGFNDQEIPELIRWAHGEGHDISLIETMPMGDVAPDRVDQYQSLTELLHQLKQNWAITQSSHKTGGPAVYYDIAETGGRLGLITPMSHNFCESCNRVRLTCTGILYMCLGQEDSYDLRQAYRNGENMISAIREAITMKPKGHDFVIDRDHGGISIDRHMSVTGG